MIPLEDNFNDVIGKAQRGLKLSDEQLSIAAAVGVEQITRVKGGEFDEPVLRKLAPALKLAANSLVAHGRKAWRPKPSGEIPGFAAFNTPFEDMTVNSYLVWDQTSKEAVAFDTGATAGPMLQAAKERGLAIKLILLTHTHLDHVMDLARLKKETGANSCVGADENFSDAESFQAGKTFMIGSLKIQTRQTAGHARGGITYLVSGLSRPLAVVGDALFASSMGGGQISYDQALSTNRQNLFTLPDDTVVCPGHGPLTTIGEEKLNNPFYPEFQKP
ncbi:MAG: MBL fold metallo-hydrolase [Pedosphaera sp.]|nr:MBL fold metallo-hydrolase [Pedosphaera sp.]